MGFDAGLSADGSGGLHHHPSTDCFANANVDCLDASAACHADSVGDAAADSYAGAIPDSHIFTHGSRAYADTDAGSNGYAHSHGNRFADCFTDPFSHGDGHRDTVSSAHRLADGYANRFADADPYSGANSYTFTHGSGCHTDADAYGCTYGDADPCADAYRNIYRCANAHSNADRRADAHGNANTYCHICVTAVAVRGAVFRPGRAGNHD
jgi:hypothetical protein